MPDASMNRVIHFLRRAVGPGGAEDDADLLRRFIAAREEAAFAGLVRRHGAMVLGVCRRVLDDAHDAEDAFQATFLVLARRAGSVRKQNSVASWLYGVAYRVARKARTAAAQRHRAGGESAEPVSAADPVAEAAWRELRPLIDEELSRLPEKYRAPLVLCYLEGKTNEEAARLLGWTKGTVSGRLARARDLLRPRLARRGLALATGAVALLLAQHGAAPASEALTELTIQAVLAGGVSAPVAALAGGVIRAMFLKRAAAWAVVVALGLLGGGAGLLRQPAPAAPGGDEEGQRVVGGADKGEPAKPKPGVVFNLPEEPKKESEDLRKLQGTWQAIGLEHDGKKLPEEAVKKVGLVISNSRITFNSDKEKRTADFRLKESSRPKQMWLTPHDSKTEVPVQAIYALEDDRLKLCLDNDEGKATPTEFAAPAGSGLTLMVLERVRFTTAERKAPGDGARFTVAGSGSPMRAVAFSPDGKSVWGCPEDGRLTRWDVTTGKVLATLNADGNKWLAMAVSPDGKHVLIGGTIDATEGKGDSARKVEAGVMSLYTANFKDAWYEGNDSGVRAVAFSPDGKRVAAACDNGFVLVRDAETGRAVMTPGRPEYGRLTAVAFSPDGKLLAAGSAHKKVRFWNVVTGRETRVDLEPPEAVTAVSFSPDGRFLLTACGDCAVQLWDVASGKEVRQWVAATKGVQSATFSPDGKLIATGGKVGPVALWDVTTGKELARYDGHQKAVNSVAFSPDGKALATGAADGAVRLWDVAK